MIVLSGGKVESAGKQYAAGIGCGTFGDGGTITVNGGIVTARGGYRYGAGIGSGMGTSNLSFLGIRRITIAGGEIRATGALLAAGIGGGRYSAAGDILIADGTVVATGGDGGGAGIGGGSFGGDGTVTINGGTVTATAGMSFAQGGERASVCGAGIGGGNGRYLRSVIINGGDVTAVGGYLAAGIGGGGSFAFAESLANGETVASLETDEVFYAPGTVTINGGTVRASGGEEGAGIGGGWGDYFPDRQCASGSVYDLDTDSINGGTININGGNVTANGGRLGAGIGGGANAYGGTVTITGGTVWAAGGEAAAGIGGGKHGSGGTLLVTDGTVTAIGGDYGAGIGGGERPSNWSSVYEGVPFTLYSHRVHGGTVTISGGTVTANGGHKAAGIGGGRSGDGGNFTLTGGSLTVNSGDNYDDIEQLPQSIGHGVGGTDEGELNLIKGDAPCLRAGIEGGWWYHGNFTYPCRQGLYTVFVECGPHIYDRTGHCIGCGEDGGPVQQYVALVDAEGAARDDVDCLPLTASDAVWHTSGAHGGWFAVTNDLVLSSRVTVSGDVNLILCDGATLTAPKGIEVAEGHSLTVWRQSGATGALLAGTADGTDATCDLGDAAIGGGNGRNGGAVTVNGGRVTAVAGAGAQAIGHGSGASCAGSLRLPSMKVFEGGAAAQPVDHAQREAACRGSRARLADCLDHDYECSICKYCDFHHPVNYLHPLAESVYSVQEFRVFSGQTELTEGWYILPANIETGGRVTVTGDVNLVLCDGATWNALQGINVGEGGSLTIWAQSSGADMGALVAAGGSGQAGIGGGANEAGGTVRVRGGSVTAIAGAGAQAIGHGAGASDAGVLDVVSMLVFDGDTTAGPVALTDREGVCRGAWARLAPCAAHDYVDNGCRFCGFCGMNFYFDPTDSVAPDKRSEGCTAYAGQLHLETGWYAVTRNWQVDGRISVTGDVNLILCNGMELSVSNGIHVAGENRLTIWAQSGDGDVCGTLTVPSPYDDIAGIGGNEWESGGTVTINGGTVNAQGGHFGAGIGGGLDGAGGMVLINGGTVTATGGDCGPGIGGGRHAASGGTVTVNGGTVTATGGDGGAGIGGGSGGGGAGGTVTITGGTVTAVGGYVAAGIGGGLDAAGGTVMIDGGTVTAIGGTWAAAIGGGCDGSGGTVTINGGAVNAQGGQWGAGIGGGRDGASGGAITVKGGTVTVTGGEEAQAIGRGDSYNGDPGTLCVFPGMKAGCPNGSGGVDEWVPHREIPDLCRNEGITVHIEPCLDHSYGNGNDTHSEACRFCGAMESSIPYFDPTDPLQRDKTGAFGTPLFRGATTLSEGWHAAPIGETTLDGRITVSGNVNLVLCDGAVLNAVGGIRVAEGDTLTIWSQRGGTGRLNVANPGAYNAGIGGNDGESGGVIAINGGIVVTRGGFDETVMVGYEEDSLHPGRTEPVYETLHACGAGLGGGRDGGGGTILIRGGSVTATGGSSSGSAIGGGSGCDNPGSLNIDGMFVGTVDGENVNWVSPRYRLSTCRRQTTTVRVEPCPGHEYVSGICACGAMLPMDQALGGSGSADDPLLIASSGDWDALGEYIFSGYGTAGIHVLQTADISVTTTLVAEGMPFEGDYDGGGHTLTVNYDDTSRNFLAPFPEIGGATIRSLRVAGTVNGKNHCSGLVGLAAGGPNTIRDCAVAVSVSATDGYAGGFLGHGMNEQTTLEGCVFSGSVVASNAGTLWGWSDGDATATLVNCLDLSGSGSPIGLGDGMVYVTNVGYANPEKSAGNNRPWGEGNRGFPVYPVTPDTSVRIGLVDTLREYGTAGLAAGAGAFLADGILYAGVGRSVPLTLEYVGSQIFGGFELSAGALVGSGIDYTLETPATGQPATIRAVVGFPYHDPASTSHEKVAFDPQEYVAGQTGLSEGWYVVTNGVATSDRIVVTGDVNLILCDGAELNATSGITVAEGARLTIWGQGGEHTVPGTAVTTRGTGALHAQTPESGDYCQAAAIGGENGGTTGDIVVNGGVIVARGAWGAGIGRGNVAAGAVGSVTINGGHVDASGSMGSAGIGSGAYADSCPVTIAGGYVHATGCVYDATGQATPGIGTGRPRTNGSQPLSNGTITIIGGTVVAQAGSAPSGGIAAQAIGVNAADAAHNGTAHLVLWNVRAFASADATAPVAASARGDACRGAWVKVETCASHQDQNADDYCDLCGGYCGPVPPVDADGVFLIGSTDDWNVFAASVSAGKRYAGETVKMTADVGQVSTLAGTVDHPFCGTFDGGGRALTVAIASAEAFAAPFRQIDGAEIRNLTVSGTVTGGGYHAAGLVGGCGATRPNVLRDCTVAVAVSGTGYAGGIVGHGGSGTLTLDGCVFGGRVSGFANFAGGILGWCDALTLTITNCLSTGSFAPTGAGKFHPVACKYADRTVTATVADAYYLNMVIPTTMGGNLVPGAGCIPVSASRVPGKWADPVTAADGRTYYAWTSAPAGRLLAHLTFDDAGNGGANLLRAAVGADAVVRAAPATPVAGVGAVAATDSSLLSGLAAGDGAVSIPNGQHLAVPVPAALLAAPGRPFTVVMRIRVPGDAGWRCLLNMPASNDSDAMVYVHRSDRKLAVKQFDKSDGAGVYSDSAVATDRWTTLAVAFGENATDAYCDGTAILHTDGALAGSYADCAAAGGFLLVGADDGGDDALFHLSDFRIYDGAVTVPEILAGTTGAYDDWAADKAVAGAWNAKDASGVHNVFRYAFDVPEGPVTNPPLISISFDASGNPVVITPPLVNGEGFALSILATDDLAGTGAATFPLDADGETVIPKTNSPTRFFRLKAEEE